MDNSWRRCLKPALTICVLCLVSMVNTGCMATSMFCRLAVYPNAKKHEFNPRLSSLSSFSLAGEYLGTEEHQGVLMHHYQFPGLLKGDSRIVHFFLSANGYEKAFANEGERIASAEARSAWMIVNAREDSPESFEPFVNKILEQGAPAEKLSILCPCIYVGSGEFYVWDAFDHDSTRSREWSGTLSVSWRVRSKAMCAIRPVYALPVALLCLPVDAVMWVYTPFEMCFRRLEALTYVNLCEALKGDD